MPDTIITAVVGGPQATTFDEYNENDLMDTSIIPDAILQIIFSTPVDRTSADPPMEYQPFVLYERYARASRALAATNELLRRTAGQAMTDEQHEQVIDAMTERQLGTYAEVTRQRDLIQDADGNEREHEYYVQRDLPATIQDHDAYGNEECFDPHCVFAGRDSHGRPICRKPGCHHHVERAAEMLKTTSQAEEDSTQTTEAGPSAGATVGAGAGADVDVDADADAQEDERVDEVRARVAYMMDSQAKESESRET